MTAPGSVRSWPDTLDPRYLVPGRDDDLHSAQFWALHVGVDNAFEGWTLVRRTGCEALTGDWCGGDSYWQWGEKRRPDEPQVHLCVYFRADTLDQARLVARTILSRAFDESADLGTLSTGLDWAEQALLDVEDEVA